jgi:hypothetical protein
MNIKLFHVDNYILTFYLIQFIDILFTHTGEKRDDKRKNEEKKGGE